MQAHAYALTRGYSKCTVHCMWEWIAACQSRAIQESQWQSIHWLPHSLNHAATRCDCRQKASLPSLSALCGAGWFSRLFVEVWEDVSLQGFEFWSHTYSTQSPQTFGQSCNKLTCGATHAHIFPKKRDAPQRSEVNPSGCCVMLYLRLGLSHQTFTHSCTTYKFNNTHLCSVYSHLQLFNHLGNSFWVQLQAGLLSYFVLFLASWLFLYLFMFIVIQPASWQHHESSNFCPGWVVDTMCLVLAGGKVNLPLGCTKV